MTAVFLKEINSFFSSLTGYIAIALFLSLTGLFLWVFPDTNLLGYANLLDYGYASLDFFFQVAPWIFLFLAPAVTMRSFSEEYRSGTIEMLLTQPVTLTQAIAGKYLASAALILFSLLPTLVYFYTIYALGSPPGNMDAGAAWGSYIGLFLMGACLCAIGTFTSSLTANPVIAFMAGIFLCFTFFMGFEYLSGLPAFKNMDDIIQLIGIRAHYQSVSRGVVDSRDILYFLSVIVLFLYLARISLEWRRA